MRSNILTEPSGYQQVQISLHSFQFGSHGLDLGLPKVNGPCPHVVAVLLRILATILPGLETWHRTRPRRPGWVVQGLRPLALTLLRSRDGFRAAR